MNDLSGATLGKYQVLERLGRGGMADVYRAYQPGMDRYVAIKVMHGHLSEDPGFIERFKREAQSVGTLRHPNIVQVIDFDSFGDEYYMVMEYVEGDSMKAMLTKRGALPVTEALTLMIKITDAVAYAHAAGMIHRDLKPANILLGKRNPNEPILTDFGIAKILGASNLTGSGVAVGTPTYMSPEAGRGEKVDERADIYSLGIMLYEMVTGTLPYDADTPWAVILKHNNDPLPPPRSLAPDLPAGVERIILRALAKNPDDRYHTAAEFRDALRTALTTPDAEPAAATIATAPPSSNTLTTQLPKKTKSLGEPGAPAAVATSSRPSVGRLIGIAVLVIAIAAFALTQIANDGDQEAQQEVAQTRSAVSTVVDVTQTAVALISTVAATEVPVLDATAIPSSTVTSTSTPEPTTTTAPTATITATVTAEATAVAVAVENDYADLRAEIEQKLNDGLYDDALDQTSAALAADPQNYYLQVLYATVLVRFREDGDKLEQAKQIAETAINNHPDRPEAYVVMADYWGGSPFEDAAKTVEYLTLAIDHGMEDASLYSRRANIKSYLSETTPESIIADLDKAIELAPNNPDYYHNRGLYYLITSNYAAAQPDFEKSIQLSDDLWRHGDLATVYLLQGNDDAAFELYRSHIEDKVISDAAYIADGAFVADRTGHPQAAEKWVEMSLVIEPNNPRALYARAMVEAGKDDYEAALKTLDQVAALNDIYAYNTPFLNWWYFDREINADRARALVKLDKTDEALAAYDAAIELNSDWLEPYIEQARLYAKLGDKVKARERLRDALQRASDNNNTEVRDRILEALREIGE